MSIQLTGYTLDQFFEVAYAVRLFRDSYNRIETFVQELISD